MILLHIIGGLLGLNSDAVALSAQKGGKLHRKSGRVFVDTMLVMSASGALMAARMCLAPWIAAAPFFLGQSEEFPEALRIMPVLCTRCC